MVISTFYLKQTNYEPNKYIIDSYRFSAGAAYTAYYLYSYSLYLNSCHRVIL